MWCLIVLLWSVRFAVSAEEALPSLFRVRTVVDSQGMARQLGQKPGVKAVVLVFLGPECPISQRYVPELKRIAALHQTNAVEFYGVVAGRQVTLESVAAFVKDYAIDFPVLVDESLALARWLRPTHVPESFVLKPDGDVVYHGRIDDWYQALGKPRTVVQQRELRDGISALLAGRNPPRIYARPVGCYFEELSGR